MSKTFACTEPLLSRHRFRLAEEYAQTHCSNRDGGHGIASLILAHAQHAIADCSKGRSLSSFRASNFLPIQRQIHNWVDGRCEYPENVANYQRIPPSDLSQHDKPKVAHLQPISAANNRCLKSECFTCHFHFATTHLYRYCELSTPRQTSAVRLCGKVCGAWTL